MSIIDGTFWRHKARGTCYQVVGESECSTTGWHEGEVVVVYRCLKTGKLWHRRVGQFLDGRFEKYLPEEDVK